MHYKRFQGLLRQLRNCELAVEILIRVVLLSVAASASLSFLQYRSAPRSAFGLMKEQGKTQVATLAEQALRQTGAQ